MRARALAALFLVAFGALPLVPPAPAAAPAALPLDLGYGPSVLFPVQGGTPIFTVGDQVWAMSHFNATIQVRLSPLVFIGGSNSSALSRELEPGVPARLLTVNSTDFQGVWTVQAVNSTFPEAAFLVGDAAAQPANLTLAAYHLAKGRLGLNFTTSPGLQMYGASVCVLGGGDPSVAQVQLPAGIGRGDVNVSKTGGSLIAVPGQGGANYSLSVELYRSVSFLLPDSASTLVSRMVQVAATDSELVGGGGPVVLPLRNGTRLWPGTYQLRAIFEGGGGVPLLSTTEVIMTGRGGWVWLGACTSSPVYSNDFVVSAPLGSDPGSWPRSAWLTYEVSGVQGLAYLPLKVNLSAVDFVGVPWGARLSGYSVRVSSASGVKAYDVSNGTIFAVLDAPEGQIAYEAGPGNDYYFSGTAGPLAPFSVSQVGLDVSKLVVQYLVAGRGFAGGKVRVSDPAGTVANATTAASGNATFYLPPGRYNVTATGGNNTAAATTGLTAGAATQLVLGGATGAAPETAVLAALGAAGLIGAVANLALWARRRDGTRGQGRKPSQK